MSTPYLRAKVAALLTESLRASADTTWTTEAEWEGDIV